MSYINAVNSTVQQFGDDGYKVKSADASGVVSQNQNVTALKGQVPGTDKTSVQNSDEASVKYGSSERKADQVSTGAQDSTEKAEQISEAELEKQREKARELTQKLNAQNIGLNFDIDDKYDRVVIKVTNNSTKDLVRQIPSEDLMRFEKLIANFEQDDGSSGKDSSYGVKATGSRSDMASAIKGLIFDTRA